jgi:hypothetical protein
MGFCTPTEFYFNVFAALTHEERSMVASAQEQAVHDANRPGWACILPYLLQLNELNGWLSSLVYASTCMLPVFKKSLQQLNPL